MARPCPWLVPLAERAKSKGSQRQIRALGGWLLQKPSQSQIAQVPIIVRSGAGAEGTRVWVVRLLSKEGINDSCHFLYTAKIKRWNLQKIAIKNLQLTEHQIMG